MTAARPRGRDVGGEDLRTAVHVSLDLDDDVPEVTVLTRTSEPPGPDEAHPAWTISDEIELPAPPPRRRRATPPRAADARDVAERGSRSTSRADERPAVRR